MLFSHSPTGLYLGQTLTILQILTSVTGYVCAALHSLPVPQAPPSSGWRWGQTWGLDHCPFVSQAPWVFRQQEACESPTCPIVLQDAWSSPSNQQGLCGRVGSGWRGQPRAWQGWAAEPGAQGLQNPQALWDGNCFSSDTIPSASPPGSQARVLALRNGPCSVPALAFRDRQGEGTGGRLARRPRQGRVRVSVSL